MSGTAAKVVCTEEFVVAEQFDIEIREETGTVLPRLGLPNTVPEDHRRGFGDSLFTLSDPPAPARPPNVRLMVLLGMLRTAPKSATRCAVWAWAFQMLAIGRSRTRGPKRRFLLGVLQKYLIWVGYVYLAFVFGPDLKISKFLYKNLTDRIGKRSNALSRLKVRHAYKKSCAYL